MFQRSFSWYFGCSELFQEYLDAFVEQIRLTDGAFMLPSMFNGISTLDFDSERLPESTAGFDRSIIDIGCDPGSFKYPCSEQERELIDLLSTMMFSADRTPTFRVWTTMMKRMRGMYRMPMCQ